MREGRKEPEGREVVHETYKRVSIHDVGRLFAGIATEDRVALLLYSH